MTHIGKDSRSRIISKGISAGKSKIVTEVSKCNK
jgi:Fe-S cluster assembly scaffold protein SufB